MTKINRKGLFLLFLLNKEIGRDGNDTFGRAMIVQQIGSSNVERVHFYDIAEEVCVRLSLLSCSKNTRNIERHPTIQLFSLDPAQNSPEWIQQTSTP